MNIIDRALGGLGLVRKKEIVVEGGLDLLAKMTGKSMSKSAMLDRYNKSLYVFSCVSKIAEKVSSIDLEMMRVKNSRGDTEEVFSSPALDLLYKCNPFQTRSEFWQITVINLKCSGDAFWYKVRNDRGEVGELWNLRPDLVTIVTDDEKFVRGYELNRPDGKQEKFAPEDIVHFRMPDPMTPYWGTGPLKAARSRVETEGYATDYQRDFFLNSARPDAVIKTEGSLDKEQRDEIKEGWDARYKGPGNGSKVAILYGGLEYQLISLSQKEMDFIESQKFNRDDILVAFGVPKSVLGVVEDVNRANAEASYAVFLSETIKPCISQIVEKINEELIYPDFGEQFYLDFEDPTPENREQVRQELDTYVNRNILLLNEAREMIGRPPVKGGWTVYIPMNLVAVGGLPQEQKFLKVGGESKEEAYEKPLEAKRYKFRGRTKLREVMNLREKFINQLKADVESRLKEKMNGGRSIKVTKAIKTKGKALIVGEEVRLAYANMINKKIDHQASSIEEKTANYAKDQEGRVLEKLNKVKAKGKKISVSIEEIFDKDKEVGLAIEFIMPEIRRALEAAANDALDMVAPQESFDTTKRVEDFIKARAKFFAESINSTTLEGLEKTLAEGLAEGEGIYDLRKRVEAVYQDFPAYRSELIARTEATAANNEGLQEGFKQSGVANAKEWINAGDGRVRDEHKDGVGVGGEIIGLDAKFSNGLSYPSEPNCRCVLGPAFIE